MRLLLILASVAGVALLLWWRFARRPGADDALTALEMKRLLDRRARSQRIEAALVIRFNLVEDAKKAGGPNPTAIIDPAIRALARQEDLLEQITAAEETTDRAELLRQADDAKVEAEVAKTPADRDSAQKKVVELEGRLAQLDALETRKAELGAAADQLVFGLRGVHLAMLDAASQKASTTDPLATAYAQLDAARKKATERDRGTHD